MYRDICITNKEEILNWLDALALELNNIRSLIARHDENLETYFAQAKQLRETAFN